MIDLGQGFPGSYKGKMAHVSQLDAEVFRKFLAKYESQILAMWFDVRVGEGAPAQPDLNEATNRSMFMNAQRRIDVVLQFTNAEDLYICEIRPRAGPSALGQIIVLYYLFTKDDTRKAWPLIITDKDAQDMTQIWPQFNINIIETDV